MKQHDDTFDSLSLIPDLIIFNKMLHQSGLTSKEFNLGYDSKCSIWYLKHHDLIQAYNLIKYNNVVHL